MSDIRVFFGSLTGKWDIERTINASHKLYGQANYQKSAPDELLYSENCFDQNNQRFEKKYYYSLITLNEKHIINIYLKPKKNDLFAEVRDLSDNKYHEYKCKKDLYKYSIESMLKNKFITHCQITGPNKNYIIKTLYRR